MIYAPDKVVLSRAHPVAVVGWRPDVASLIPHAREGVLGGARVLVVRHGVDETRLLSNLGLQVPSPIRWRYDWAGNTPFEAQRATAELMTSGPHAFVLNEMATGKTLSALFAFDFLRQEGLARTMLVSAPLSTLRDTWLREIERRMPHLRASVVHGEYKRARLAAEADVYIINHDGVRHIDMSAKTFDVVCIDELTAYKTATSKRSKAMRSVARGAKFVWGMTGTPTARGPEDAFGQIKLVAPDQAPASFTRWRDKVCVRVSQFKWVPRANANDIVFEAMTPAVRFRRDEVVELPPLSIIDRDVEMSARQRRTYDQVMKKLQASVAEGTITAANEGVKLNKLLQISSGFAYTDVGTALLDPKPRLDLIREIAENADGKMLVFSPFVAGVHLIADALAAGGLEFGRITGATSLRARTEIFERFREDPDCPGIVAHPGTMSHGLNLTEANIIVWAAPFPSLEVYEQANARITRPGQTKRQVIYRLTGSPVEARVYRRLSLRETMQNALLGMFE